MALKKHIAPLPLWERVAATRPGEGDGARLRAVRTASALAARKPPHPLASLGPSPTSGEGLCRGALISASLLVLAALASSPAKAQTLQDALISAYQHNPQLQSDRARQRAVDEDVSRAWGGYRPQVVAQGSAGRAKDNITYPANTGFPNANDVRSPQMGTLQVTQQIWDGNRTLADVDHSKWSVKNGRAILTSTEQGVFGDVITAYYDLYRDQKILEIQQDYVNSLQYERKAASERFKVKDVTRTDVAQAEARLARGIADQQQYEGNVEVSKSAFLRTVGFPAGKLPAPPAVMATLPEDLPQAVKMAERNPDLRAAIFAEKAAESDVDYAESGLLPDLYLQGTATRATGNDQYNSNYRNSQVTVNVSIPLYDGGVASARSRAAKHTVGQRKLDIDVQRDRVLDQIKRSWENLQATRARIRSLEETAKAADIAWRGMQQEVRVGSRTVIDELNAHQEVLDTQIALLRSQHDEAIAQYSLVAAIGQLTANGLRLPIEKYDPKAHYQGSSYLPWGPWIDTNYPESPEAPSDDN